MKNLILFTMLVVAAISCTSDDNVATTPFEGRWVVLNCAVPGTPPPPEPSKTPNEALIEANEHLNGFHFRGNKYLIVNSGEIIQSGTFTYSYDPTGYYDPILETYYDYILILAQENGIKITILAKFGTNDFLNVVSDYSYCLWQRIK